MSSEEEVLAEQAALEAAEYERLKLELQLWTIGTSIFGTGAVWLMYSKVGSHLLKAVLREVNIKPELWLVELLW